MKITLSVNNKEFTDHALLPGILNIDTDKDEVSYQEFITLPENVPPDSSPYPYSFDELVSKFTKRITGLAKYKDGMLAIGTNSIPPVAIYYKGKEILDVWHLEIPDPRSICVVGDNLYVAAVGDNSVYEFELGKCINAPFHEKPNSGKAEYSRKVFSDDTVQKDITHVNGVIEHHGKLYVSAFGKKKGQKWDSADEGYIKDLERNKPIAGVIHPHSMFSYGDALFYCESATSSVKNTFAQSLVIPDNGYTRGLAIKDDFLIVAASDSRAKSCQLYFYFIYHGLQHGKLVYEKDLTPYCHEIYDIVVH